MVNVGGRSRGCTTCRRRRVKCDEGRPICNRCKRCGFQCDGPKGTTFIEDQSQEYRRQRKVASSTSFETRDGSLQKPNANRLCISLPLSLSAFEDNICLAYTDKILIRGGLLSHSYDMIDLKIPVSHMNSDYSYSTLHCALLSLAFVFYGQHEHQEFITRKGYQLYSSALTQLNLILSNPVYQTQDSTILIVVSLVFLEAFVPSGRGHYLTHILGLERMLEIRGPPDPSTLSFKIVQGLRIILISGSLTMSTPSIFARSKWKRVFANTDAVTIDRSLRNSILNILADCTAIRHSRDALILSTSLYNISDGGLHEECLKSASELLQSLETLRRYENLRSFAAPLSPASYHHDHKLYQQASSEPATTLMLYNTAIIYVLDIITSLFPDVGHSSRLREAAMEICYCLEYNITLKSPRSPEAMTIGHIAVKAAWHALGNGTGPEKRRFRQAVNQSVAGVLARGLWDE